MKNFTLMLALALLCSVASASEPKAGAEAQQKFWAFTEQIAIALPGDGDDLTNLISRHRGRASASIGNDKNSMSTQIGPSLFVDDVKVQMGENNRADSVSFRLSGSCLSLGSVRKRYSNLLVLAHGASELEWNNFGTQVGDSIVAFWFQGTNFGCMQKVEVTPAAGIVSRLNLD